MFVVLQGQTLMTWSSIFLINNFLYQNFMSFITGKLQKYLINVGILEENVQWHKRGRKDVHGYHLELLVGACIIIIQLW